MEEWGFIDNRDLQIWKDSMACVTCQHFTYGADQHCRTTVGYNLTRKQPQQGQHLKKHFKR